MKFYNSYKLNFMLFTFSLSLSFNVFSQTDTASLAKTARRKVADPSVVEAAVQMAAAEEHHHASLSVIRERMLVARARNDRVVRRRGACVALGERTRRHDVLR